MFVPPQSFRFALRAINIPYQHSPYNTLFDGYIFHTKQGPVKIPHKEMVAMLDNDVIHPKFSFKDPNDSDKLWVAPDFLVREHYDRDVLRALKNLIDKKIALIPRATCFECKCTTF